jgi:hypothetical protein
MSNFNVCSTCGAPIQESKCEFCGNISKLIDKNESPYDYNNEQKRKAEKEFFLGNTDSALFDFEILYKINPKDPFIIVRRAQCLFYEKELDTSEFFSNLKIAHELAPTDDFLKFTIKSFIETLFYHNFFYKEKNPTGLCTYLIDLCNNKSLIDYAINILIDKTKKDNEETLALVLIYSSVNQIFKRLSSEEIKHQIFKNDLEYYIIVNVISKLNEVNKSFWKINRIKKEGGEISLEWDFNLEKLYVFDEIEFPFVEKIIDWYILRSFGGIYIGDGARSWEVEEWNKNLSKIPKDFKKIYIIEQLNEIISNTLQESYKLDGGYTYNYPLDDKLKKKGACFIATAAMDDYNHPIVIDLRQFRDEWLLKRSWGVSFTNWYYTHGPKAANIINQSTILKKITFYAIIKPLQVITKNLR